MRWWQVLQSNSSDAIDISLVYLLVTGGISIITALLGIIYRMQQKRISDLEEEKKEQKELLDGYQVLTPDFLDAVTSAFQPSSPDPSRERTSPSSPSAPQRRHRREGSS